MLCKQRFVDGCGERVAACWLTLRGVAPSGLDTGSALGMLGACLQLAVFGLLVLGGAVARVSSIQREPL